MSLINKMLQDLDARGGAGDEAVQSQELKAVPVVERDRRPLLFAGAGLAAVALAVGGWYGWQYWSAPPAPVPKVVDNSIPNRPRLQEPPVLDMEPGKTSDRDAASASKTAAASEPASPSPSSSVAAKSKRITSGADAAGFAAAAEAAGSAGTAVTAGVPGAAGNAAEARAAVPRERKPARTTTSATASAHGSGAGGSVGVGGGINELTPKQVAENTYRRALVSLQEGRVSTALADLDRALEIDPRNDAARQTYISLLLENRRNDDAIRQLRLALGIDPRQPGLAMVLARLQLEKGGPALQTLLATLPHASGNADYQAFLAGVLQREQRHAEAAQHYREALRVAPQNGVWWMGLGISLQADQHLPEARAAYSRARAASGLTPELQSFVDRKLEQLSR